jgi:predicted RNA-binding Zn-ribbon protein involved in translation (DUF1610 family)
MPCRVELDRFLHQLGIRVDAFSHDALRQAAGAWTTYLRTRGQEAQCPHCGHRFVAACLACHHHIAWRQCVSVEVDALDDVSRIVVDGLLVDARAGAPRRQDEGLDRLVD